MDLDEWRRWYPRKGEAGIRTILNEQWDPIDVADVVADEYDAYIPQVAGALRRGDGAEGLAALLARIRAVEMGLSPDDGVDLRVANTLRDWYNLAMHEGTAR